MDENIENIAAKMEKKGDCDECNEEIAATTVTKQDYFPEWLETSQPEPEKLGIPIEDTLKTPCRKAENASVPSNEMIVEENIEAVERQPENYCELLDFSLFEDQN